MQTPDSQTAARPKLPPLDTDLRTILGRPCFACIQLAESLRLAGFEIGHRAEDEQAAVLHFLLGFYLSHGAAWATVASADIKARIEARRGTGAAEALGATTAAEGKS